MRLAITGACGFVGRAVVRRIRADGGFASLRLVDIDCAPDPDFETLSLDLAATEATARIVKGMDCVLHLAALPGGSAEKDPVRSRRVNCGATLDIAERMGGGRFVLASSIAVFGGSLDHPVDDATTPVPDSVYGTHKRMAELGFADAVRRGAASGVTLRLPGVVARPPSAAGFGSAFLSDVFHAAREARPYTLPVAWDAASWIMSVERCADNLLHAVSGSFTSPDALTLPALHVRMDALVRALGAIGDARGIDVAEQADIRRRFGSYPALDAAAAVELGFRADADIADLVARSYADG